MHQKVFLYTLLYLFLLYLNIVLTFSVLYLYLDYSQLGPIIDHFSSQVHQNSWLDRVTRTIYFSAITLMSVGYGDVTPFGLSKVVAIIEAIIGYILPPALVVRYILFPTKSVQRLMTNPPEKENDYY